MFYKERKSMIDKRILLLLLYVSKEKKINLIKMFEKIYLSSHLYLFGRNFVKAPGSYLSHTNET